MLEIHRASIDPTLESLAQDGIERFLHCKKSNRVGDRKQRGQLHLLKRARRLHGLLYKQRSVAKSHGQVLEITASVENIDRQADTEDTLS